MITKASLHPILHHVAPWIWETMLPIPPRARNVSRTNSWLWSSGPEEDAHSSWKPGPLESKPICQAEICRDQEWGWLGPASQLFCSSPDLPSLSLLSCSEGGKGDAQDVVPILRELGGQTFLVVRGTRWTKYRVSKDQAPRGPPAQGLKPRTSAGLPPSFLLPMVPHHCRWNPPNPASPLGGHWPGRHPPALRRAPED